MNTLILSDWQAELLSLLNEFLPASGGPHTVAQVLAEVSARTKRGEIQNLPSSGSSPYTFLVR